jgi:RNA polymerase sigma-70 factor (ECF subfamily)
MDAAFPSTCWSQIEDPGGALETLANRYWRPVHAYIHRALARSPDEARDLTQDFFVWVQESGFLSKADRERGRFRAFVKTALQNFVADADRRALAQRRGGSARFVPIDGGGDGDAPIDLADAQCGPEEALDQAWRAEIVRAAIERTRAELERRGQPIVFQVFQDYYLDPAEDVDYRVLAERLGITMIDVSNHLMRAKRVYRGELRALVLDTVANRADLDDELEWLLGGDPS